MFKKGKDFSHFELSISAIACEQRQQIIKNENDQNRGKEKKNPLTFTSSSSNKKIIRRYKRNSVTAF